MPKNNKGERNKRGSGTRMKREYVKPVIESEEFVANEYVAACWVVECNQHGKKIIYNYPSSAIDGDGYFRFLNQWYYSGKIEDNIGEDNILNLVNLHPVSITSAETARPEHPNASA